MSGTPGDTSKSSFNEDHTYSGQTIADTLRQEKSHEQMFDKTSRIQTPDGPVFRYDSDDQLLLDFMPTLQRLYDCIMANDERPVKSLENKKFVRPVYELTKVGREIQNACKEFAAREDERRHWQQIYAHHRFHPIVGVMLGAVMRWWSPICNWWNPKPIVVEYDEDAKAVEGLNQFVDDVRQVCRSQAFRNILHDHGRKAQDNFRSACDLIIALFRRRSRLLILRIDLYFRPDAKGWGYSEAADEAMDLYLRDLREGRIVPDFLKFIIKRENGVCRGMHYHLMAVLDGHERQSAYHLTAMLGEAWTKRVGADKGSYFNCYASKHRYRYNGLGKVHVSDTEKLIGLRIALCYMSKQDSVLEVDDAKGKNFWRSLMPKIPTPRGAPRKHGDGMELVERILGGKRSLYPPGFVPHKKGPTNPPTD